jgi:hypothetical protein
MKSLARYFSDKNNFESVVVVRLVHDGIYEDYSRWTADKNNLFFFDDSMKVGHILFLTDLVKEIDDTHITINPDNPKLCVGLELFYGGAIL